jgi:predicted MFS family arabinose efflux permease
MAYWLAWPTFVLYATDRHGLGVTAGLFGVLMATFALGGAAAGPLTSALTGRMSASAAAWTLAVVHTACWPMIAFTHNVWAAGLGLAFIGAVQTMLTTINAGMRQRLARPDMLNRVIAGFRWIVNAPTPLFAFVGGAIATSYGLAASMYAAGFVLLTSVIMLGPALLRRK